MKYEVVLTDTFGGELNYSIVYRANFDGDGHANSRKLALLARSAIENTHGIRVPPLRKSHDSGDSVLYDCKGHNLCVIVDTVRE